MDKVSNEFQPDPTKALIQLGKRMRDFMCIEYLSSHKSRTAFYREMMHQFITLKDTCPDISKITLDSGNIENDLDSAALPAYLELGKLAYECMQSNSEKGIQYDDLCHYVLQAFNENRLSGEANRTALLALVSPLHNIIDMYVLLGKNGLKAVDAANRLTKPSKSKYEFWRSESAINKQHDRIKTYRVRYEIAPLCLFIAEAEKSTHLGLDREKFNAYLETNMQIHYQEKARDKGLSLIDFFDTVEFPITEKHSLRDGFINEMLASDKQDYYIAGKNMLEFYRGEVSLNKFNNLYQVSNNEGQRLN